MVLHALCRLSLGNSLRTNGRIDRWARGNLDTSQGRMIEPFGPMLGSHLFSGLQGSPFEPCLCSVSSFYELRGHAAITARVPNINAYLVHRNACVRSVTACRHRALVTVWMTVLKSAVPSVCNLGFRFENDSDHPYRRKKTMIQNRGRPATWVDRLVLPSFTR